MLIKNRTGLNYADIGTIIDFILANDKEDTTYKGKIEYCTISYKKKPYRIQIRYLNAYVEYLIEEGR